MVDLSQTSNPEQLLAYVIALKGQLKPLESDLSDSLDQLNVLIENGEVDASFEFEDWSFNWSPGRTTFVYPAEILEIEAEVKTAKKKAVADGKATTKIGAPYWTIKSPRP